MGWDNLGGFGQLAYALTAAVHHSPLLSSLQHRHVRENGKKVKVSVFM